MNTQTVQTIDRDDDATELALPEILDECTSLLERAEELLGNYEPMSGDEIRRMRKVPKKGDAIISSLATLCDELEIDEAGPVTADGMTSALARAVAIRRVLELADRVTRRLDASRMLTEGDAWSAALTFYALFRGLAVRDPEVKEKIRATVDAFRPRRRRAHSMQWP